MPSHSAAEREALADALAAAGPHHPTLCDGWTTTQLAAHLVARETRPDAAIGMIIPPLSGWTQRVQTGYAALAYPDLVARFRTGPPLASFMSLPGVDARVNLAEHFVHCEDVRRALPGWEPRELPDARQAALWRHVSLWGRALFRRCPVPVTLRTPNGRSASVVRGSAEGVIVLGEPSELTLYTYGRKDQARVQVEGPDDAVATFRALILRL